MNTDLARKTKYLKLILISYLLIFSRGENDYVLLLFITFFQPELLFHNVSKWEINVPSSQCNDNIFCWNIIVAVIWNFGKCFVSFLIDGFKLLLCSVVLSKFLMRMNRPTCQHLTFQVRSRKTWMAELSKARETDGNTLLPFQSAQELRPNTL